jgi:hypothetical protein
MATRAFTDGAGVEWLIWRVTPGQGSRGPDRPTTLPEELAGGWLCFESVAGKRRMYPVPPDWETLADDKLDLLCRAGVPVAERPRHAAAPTSPEQSRGGPG